MASILLHVPGMVAIVTIAIGATLSLCFQKTRATQNEAFDLQRQILIINCRDITTGQPLPDRHKARIVPNQRLKTAFGIDNIFTTEDTEWAGKFRKLAIDTLRKALRMDPESQDEKADWSLLAKNMSFAVQQHLQTEGNSINLAKLVQFITLKVTIGYLFDIPEQILRNNKDAIVSIASRVNELWIQSKEGNGDNESIPAWHEEQALIQNLLAVIPDHDPRNPRETPMNLILPAYETMWRVVFRGLLEVRFRGSHKHDSIHHKRLLTTYLQEPNNANNWRKEYDKLNIKPNCHHTVATIDVVKEILRLYPPTRRIYRKYPDHEHFVSADLEKMHRNRDLAGDDAQAFRPARWLQIRQRFLNDAGGYKKKSRGGLKDFEEELGFMPFARICPAGNRMTNAFGWKMIALLAGSLIQGLDRLDGKWVLQAGEKGDELPSFGKALSSGREDYLSLVYERSD
ncbi:unnamed protein product [Discula destructiva]